MAARQASDMASASVPLVQDCFSSVATTVNVSYAAFADNDGFNHRSQRQSLSRRLGGAVDELDWFTGILGDFYSYDTVNHAWTPLETGGATPGTRVGLTMTCAVGRIFVFGGNAASTGSGETDLPLRNHLQSEFFRELILCSYG
jgi:hypothetical protein